MHRDADTPVRRNARRRRPGGPECPRYAAGARRRGFRGKQKLRRLPWCAAGKRATGRRAPPNTVNTLPKMNRSHRICTASIAAFLAAHLAPTASAQTATGWRGDGTTNVWSDSGNWDNGILGGLHARSFSGWRLRRMAGATISRPRTTTSWATRGIASLSRREAARPRERLPRDHESEEFAFVD